MVITAGARASGGGGGGGAVEEDGAAAHVVVVVDRSTGVRLAAGDDQQQQQQQLGGTGSGCRICHLEDGELPAESWGGKLVNLGCGCRGEIAAAHRRCAEAWFSVKGNRRCEICGQNAANISGRSGGGGGGKEFMQQWHGTAAAAEGSSKANGFCRSQTFCNLLIACLIIVFVLPWFFHNHMI